MPTARALAFVMRFLAALVALSMFAAGCGNRGDVPTPARETTTPITPQRVGPVAQTPPSPPCVSGPPDAPLMAFHTHGTHGSDFDESLTVRCNGDVVLEATVPFTTALVGRPGTYTSHLDAARVAQLRDLAVRLARPVPTPSLPPQGADTTVTVNTTPSAGHALRPGEGAADGEAAAVRSILVGEIIAALPPPPPTCGVTVELAEANAPLRANVDGLVTISLRNTETHPVYLSVPAAREAVEIASDAGSVFQPAVLAPMLDDMTVLGFIDETNRTTLTIPARAIVRMAAHVVVPGAGRVSLTAHFHARVTCTPPSPSNVPARQRTPNTDFESAPVVFDVRP